MNNELSPAGNSTENRSTYGTPASEGDIPPLTSEKDYTPPSPVLADDDISFVSVEAAGASFLAFPPDDVRKELELFVRTWRRIPLSEN